MKLHLCFTRVSSSVFNLSLQSHRSLYQTLTRILRLIILTFSTSTRGVNMMLLLHRNTWWCLLKAINESDTLSPVSVLWHDLIRKQNTLRWKNSCCVITRKHNKNLTPLLSLEDGAREKLWSCFEGSVTSTWIQGKHSASFKAVEKFELFIIVL